MRFCRHLPEVLVARVAIYHGLKKWELLALVAKRLVEWNPQEGRSSAKEVFAFGL